MFPTHKNSKKQVKNQKSTDKRLSFDGLIQEDIDLSDIYLAVLIVDIYQKKRTHTYGRSLKGWLCNHILT